MQTALFICGNERPNPNNSKIWVDPLNFRICCDHCKRFLTFAAATPLLTSHLGLSFQQKESLQGWQMLFASLQTAYCLYPFRWAQNVKRHLERKLV